MIPYNESLSILRKDFEIKYYFYTMNDVYRKVEYRFPYSVKVSRLYN